MFDEALLSQVSVDCGSSFRTSLLKTGVDNSP